MAAINATITHIDQNLGIATERLNGVAATSEALNATIMYIDQKLAMATKRLDGVAATSEALERFASFVEAELEQAHYSLSVLTVYLYVIGGMAVLAICHQWLVLYCLSSMKVEQETLVFV